MTNDKAAEAREGLLDNLAGKAKEVVGAVSGNDRLVEEGQLQQASARDRKEAVAEQAIADAQRGEAVAERRAADVEVARTTAEAQAEADREKARVAQQRATEHDTAAAAGEVQERRGSAVAEQRADELAETRVREAEAIAADATSTAQHSQAERRRLEHEADAAEQQAAQLRADIEK